MICRILLFKSNDQSNASAAWPNECHKWERAKAAQEQRTWWLKIEQPTKKSTVNKGHMNEIPGPNRTNQMRNKQTESQTEDTKRFSRIRQDYQLTDLLQVNPNIRKLLKRQIMLNYFFVRFNFRYILGRKWQASAPELVVC